MAAQENPFDADPGELAKLEGAYTACRNDVLTSAKPIAHGILRAGAPRAWWETAVKIHNVSPPYAVLVQAYAGAVVEVARMKNEADGVTVDELPEWPTTDDPREHARLRVEAFFTDLMRLCVDHQILPRMGGLAVTPWLEDLSTGRKLAASLHWCEDIASFAAHEPVDDPLYATVDETPWQVPDGHK
jgi:hypothetical protein